MPSKFIIVLCVLGMSLLITLAAVKAWNGRRRSYGSALASNTSSSSFIIEPTEVDLGMVNLHQQATARFRITNRSDHASARIVSAIPECGCLHILDYNPVLAPGSAQDLTVTFTADVANGPRFHKRVLVELLSDSRLSNYPVYVDGGYAGVAGIMAFPCRLVVRDMMPGTTLHRKLFFTGIRSLVGAIPEIVTINVSDRTSQELSLNPLPSGEKQSQTRAMDVVMTTTVGTEPGRYDRTINIHFGSQRNEVQVPLTVFVIRG